MANAYPTLATIATLDAGIGFPVVDEVVVEYKELDLFPADTMEGVTLELSVITQLPTAGFRQANSGVDRKTATFETKQFSTAILEQQVAVDPMVLKSSKDPARALENLSKPHMRAVMALCSKQIWYGSGSKGIAAGGDLLGFPGIIDQYSADTLHEVNAAGTTSLSSVWFLWLAPENLQLIWGNGQTLTQRDWRQETIYDVNNKPLDGLTSSITGRVGLKLENKHAAIRIKNLDPQTITGTGLNRTYSGGLNDDWMYQARQKFEELMRMPPNAIFGTPRSFEQLRRSRIPINAMGAPVAYLDNWEGIPLHRTINISNSEAVA